MLADAGGELLCNAVATGAVRTEVTITDLLTLVNAVSLVTEHNPDGADATDRLLTLALEGIRPPAET